MGKSLAEDGLRYCKRGHPRTPENVDSQSHCKICRAAYKATYDAIRYQNLSGYGYNLMLLRHRRSKALASMAERRNRKEAS